MMNNPPNDPEGALKGFDDLKTVVSRAVSGWKKDDGIENMVYVLQTLSPSDAARIAALPTKKEQLEEVRKAYNRLIAPQEGGLVESALTDCKSTTRSSMSVWGLLEEKDMDREFTLTERARILKKDNI